MNTLKTCEICNNIFDRPLNTYGNKIAWSVYSKRRFCSNKCRGTYHSQTLIGSKNPNYRGGKTKCIDCGTELAARYSYRLTLRCRKCRGKGEWNPNYKPVLTYKYLHTMIRKQLGDPAKCSKCGVQGQKIRGKWNIQWANIAHQYHRTHDDWVALCPKCHTQFDLSRNS